MTAATHTALMPAAFIGHGNPMNALDRNRYTEAWRAFADSAPPPRAIVVISAHWYINATAVTAMAAPRTIHDFYGFPQELFDVEYPAPGAPDLIAEIAEVAKPTWVGADADSWGLDHGTWSVLRHMYPAADVPVVQLAINAVQPFDYHVELGIRLAALRSSGVLVLGSGNVVHNLGAIDFGLGDVGSPWAHRFDDDARGLLTTSPADVLRLQSHADFHAAVPTPDHYIPMLYIAGIAAAAGVPAEVLVDGYFGGSLSMTSYTVGAGAALEDEILDAGRDDAGDQPAMPDVPADESNI
jgi:4,5-DOPA dioxygenase extradiol